MVRAALLFIVGFLAIIGVNGQSTVDIIEGNNVLSILNSILDALDLKGLLSVVNTTIFAPTDAAFEALEVNLTEIPTETIAFILQYHVSLDANLTTDNMDDAEVIDTLNGDRLFVVKPLADVGLEDSTGIMFFIYYFFDVCEFL